ncbi:hypothetical protein ACJMK2_027734 [Sinanodonta woodiana]|uniref:RRM domain-containing protein n=1 Tax=Sinanodonta woodiana TaxID=1069815 RepID=A0ABD3X4V6_SINWO
MAAVIPQQPISASERAARSVFVGNIPYEATEEQLKDIFTQAGPVVSFRLVYDRETGKPKGYGFCEYQDLETAQSALRNLNNYDFNGRPLRVGVAAGEQNKDDMQGMQQALGGPLIESPYGDPVEPEKAPEAISKAVASLPPEQMFELMKQMKLCIQNNPTEARNMLLQNPQLAYALLQAQIVMKIVDPQVAMAMLHRDTHQIPPSSGPASGVPSSQPNPLQNQPIMPPNSMGPGGPGPMSMPSVVQPPQQMGPGPGMGPPMMRGPQGGSLLGPGPGPGPGQILMGGPGPRPDMGGPGPRPYMGPGLNQPRPDLQDPRLMQDPRGPPMLGPPASLGPPTGMGQGPQVMQRPPMVGLPNLGGLASLSQQSPGISAQDQEKAALIMQVLQLTDQQIAMLPPEQRQSILILKEQISKSQ